MRTKVPQPANRDSKHGERGSALLVVLLFAAIVGIFLYREIPVVVTEAKRQREGVLVQRGMEYQRAIQLYYRKMGRYPPTMAALENTNNIRFLRKRYKDPLTGEDEWRLIHMGQAGPVDSLVKPLNTNGNGQPFGQNATNSDGFGQSSFGQSNSGQSGFGSSFGSNSASSANSNQGGQQTAANQSAGNGGQGQIGETPADGNAAPNRRPPPVSASGTFGDDATNGMPGQSIPLAGGVQPGANGAPGQDPNQPGAGGQANGQGGNGANSNSQIADQILRTAGPTITPQQQQAPTTASNPFSAGNLAGVASRGKGHSLKVINDQTDYSKWEFIYDYRKDATAGAAAAGAALAGAGGNNVNGTSNNQSAFGQQSSFGQTGPTTGATAAPAPSPSGAASPGTSPNQ